MICELFSIPRVDELTNTRIFKIVLFVGLLPQKGNSVLSLQENIDVSIKQPAGFSTTAKNIG